MAEQSKLKQLLNYRDRTMQQVTKQILGQIEHVTSAVQTFFEFDQEQGYIISWDDVSFTDEAKQDQNGLLILVGTIYYQDQPVNVVKIGIPFDLAVDSSQQDIVQFLQQNAAVDQQDDEDIDVAVEQGDIDDLVEPDAEQLEQASETVDQQFATDNSSFDLEQLTPEQKQRLEWFTLTADHGTSSKTN